MFLLLSRLSPDPPRAIPGAAVPDTPGLIPREYLQCPNPWHSLENPPEVTDLSCSQPFSPHTHPTALMEYFCPFRRSKLGIFLGHFSGVVVIFTSRNTQVAWPLSYRDEREKRDEKNSPVRTELCMSLAIPFCWSRLRPVRYFAHRKGNKITTCDLRSQAISPGVEKANSEEPHRALNPKVRSSAGTQPPREK